MIKEYNPKIDYLIAKYLTKDINHWDDGESLLKKIYNEEIEPINKYHQKFIKAKQCLMLIKKQTRLDIEIIGSCYEIMANEQNHKIDLLKKIISNNDETMVLWEVIEKKVFNKYNFEMAVLIFNYKRLLSNKLPIAFVYGGRMEIEDSINKKDENRLKEIIRISLYKSIKLNQKHRKLSLETIKNKIINNKEYMIQQFGIKKIYFFGSFARDETNEYSDLDIFIKVHKKRKSDLKNKKEIFQYLNRLIGIPVDGYVNDNEFKYDSLSNEIKITMKRII